MNCFTHALPYLDDPYYAVGSCIPDWLSAVDRKVRVRKKLATPFVDADDPVVASLAKGVIQHLDDDDWFHRTEAFAEMSMTFSMEIRDLLGGDSGFRGGLMGHIVIELMLDAYLDQEYPGRLEEYYQAVALVDADKVQQTVNQFAKAETDKLVRYFELFLHERYIFDYANDQSLLYRVNRVMQRVKLEPFGTELDDWLPKVRDQVYSPSWRVAPFVCDSD